ncbi:Metacaspase-1B [Seminavis robusta]|uniref:Metacaspase-1B n=1 Tax=Seminavis robusta TaxID=568900 RepID=A0A9N8DQK8_9STRA|nr:Metacaspase-1B [Seminavis robusta]|eukprot:Sro284_g107980.1 Metacaspase-1B (385) ;mRNA; r:58269-59888
MASSSSSAAEGSTSSSNNDTFDPSLVAQAEAYIHAEVHLFSGCRDEQTSADISNVELFGLPDPQGRAGGACTSAMLKALYATTSTSESSMSYGNVLSHMRSILSEGQYTQIPQLTSSRPVDMHAPFHIVPTKCQDGVKRAVLIGINYTGTRGELSGCHNDVKNVKKYLQTVHDFQEENITMLLDDGDHTPPTKANILKAYDTLVKQCQEGDAVFCHYAGHGGSVPDTSGDEEDGYDETMIPIDYKTAGHVVDDELFKVLICPMPKGVVLNCLVDCCHSGTILDLPFTFIGDGTQQQMTFDKRFQFPHAKLVQNFHDGVVDWHWTVYVASVITAIMAIAVPIVLLLLPISTTTISAPESVVVVPPQEPTGPLTMVRNLVRSLRRK